MIDNAEYMLNGRTTDEISAMVGVEYEARIAGLRAALATTEVKEEAAGGSGSQLDPDHRPHPPEAGLYGWLTERKRKGFHTMLSRKPRSIFIGMTSLTEAVVHGNDESFARRDIEEQKVSS